MYVYTCTHTHPPTHTCTHHIYGILGIIFYRHHGCAYLSHTHTHTHKKKKKKRESAEMNKGVVQDKSELSRDKILLCRLHAAASFGCKPCENGSNFVKIRRGILPTNLCTSYYCVNSCRLRGQTCFWSTNIFSSTNLPDECLLTGCPSKHVMY